MKSSNLLKGLLVGGLILSSTTALAATKLYQGIGKAVNLKPSSKKDSKGGDVYSINYVTAAGVFDEEGRIVNVRVDVLEVATPNTKGATTPRFSGWPNTPGYNVTDVKTGEVVGISENTVDNIKAEVAGWKTKRERGETYKMNPRNEWDKQMDFFENYFKGKTVDELEAWFAKNTSDINGRPLKEKSAKEEDKAKFAKLTEQEKAELADLTAGATMSVRDSHGDILGAIKDAYNNRVEFMVK